MGSGGQRARFGIIRICEEVPFVRRLGVDPLHVFYAIGKGAMIR